MNQRAMMQLRKMQKEMMDAQERIHNTEFCGSAGGGMVVVTMKGDYTVVSVKIDEDAFESKDDLEMIQDSLQAAFNDCIKQIAKKTEEDLGGYTAGLGGLGGLF